MAKIYFLLATFFFVAVTVSLAAPIEELTELEDQMRFLDEPNDFTVEGRADRQRRVTCDLLSFGGKVGSSACAANCLSMGKAGGYCNDKGVCVCRKDTIGDLWRKRFG